MNISLQAACGSFLSPCFSYAYNIVVGIHKIVFDDGEIREVDPDDVQFFTCVLK